MTTTRYDATREDLASLLAGEPPYRVRQVWDGLHRRALEPSEMTDLPRALRHRRVLPPRVLADLDLLERTGTARETDTAGPGRRGGTA